MTNEIPPKRWAITAVLDDARLFFTRDEIAVTPFEGAQPILSPVEFLLLAAAGCMALSIKAAVLADQQTFSGARVVANGIKFQGSPSRLGSMDLQVFLNAPLPPSAAERVLEEAKRVCTVSNTITDAPSVAIALQSTSVPGSRQRAARES